MGPVFPIFPSFTRQGTLDLKGTSSYVKYLATQGAKTLMTTAGTSQFNLLELSEIVELNNCVADSFPGKVILGAPPLAEHLLVPFLTDLHSKHPRALVLVVYPERYYSDHDFLSFFSRVGKSCPFDKYIHGLPLRLPQGALLDYSSNLISQLITADRRIIGMKEECSTYEMGFSLSAGLSHRKQFELIVAGGSMRRYLLLQAAGARSFLAGVGSLFPLVEHAFYSHMESGRLKEATTIIANIETPLFQVFMGIGWHKSLRHAAKYLGFIDKGERGPMRAPTQLEKASIESAVNVVKNNIRKLRKNSVL